MRRRDLTALTLLAAGLAAAAAAATVNRDPRQLKPGVFLYAAPGMGDANFAESVVLLIEHTPAGSMGLVINRPTRVPLQELLPFVKAPAASDLRFHWGGPVQQEAILALVRTNWPSEGARQVLPGVYLTGELADVRAALALSNPGERLRVFSGYAGWGKGQLAAELQLGAWVVDRADARAVFAPDSSGLWFRVYRILERLEARVGLDGGRQPARLTAAGGP
jgi:putative transcriptional regulator